MVPPRQLPARARIAILACAIGELRSVASATAEPPLLISGNGGSAPFPEAWAGGYREATGIKIPI